MIVATAANIFGKWIRPSELRALLVDQRIRNFAGPWLAVFVATKDEGGHDTASILNVSGHSPQHAGALSATTSMGVARLDVAKEPECFMATPVAFGFRNVPEKGGRAYLLGSPDAQATPSPRSMVAICAMSASSMTNENKSRFWRIRSGFRLLGKTA